MGQWRKSAWRIKDSLQLSYRTYCFFRSHSKHSAVSIEDANAFLNRFAHNRPSARLLAELRSTVSRALPAQRHSTIFEYCLDIAAACTTQYPYGLRHRIIDEEKNC